MASEFELKKLICDIGRRMYDKGFVAANDGNISCRVGKGRFLCTPTLMSKGFLRPADIAVVDDKGRQLEGPLARTSEILLHLEIYHELSEINAVCHAHPPYATAFAVAGIDVPSNILPEVEIFIGQVPIAEYETPGGEGVAKTLLPHLRRKANTILLANHGAVACDKTLEQAFFHLDTLDMYCRILLLSKEVGNIRQLPPEKVRELLAIKKSLGIADPRMDGQEVAALAGSDEFLRGFSTRAIPQHTADANGHGRGQGIAGQPSQAGQAQPLPAGRQLFPAMVDGRVLPGPDGMGASSETARRRSLEDQTERLVQIITDRIVQIGSGS